MRNLTPVAAALAALALAACDDGGSSTFVPPITPTPPTISFATRQEVDAGMANVRDGVFSDLDGDGAGDLVVGGADGTVQLMLAGAGATFTMGSNVTLARGVSVLACGDLDGDGDRDVVAVINGPAQAFVLLNDGAGNLTQLAPLGVPGSPTEVRIADVDGDGNADLVVAATNGGVRLFTGNGDGTFSGAFGQMIPVGARLSGLVVDDVDGDGSVEVVVCDTDNDQILIGDQPGLQPSTVAVGDGPVGVAFGDVTGDGVGDLAVTNFLAQTVEVLAFDGSNWSIASTISVMGPPGRNAVLDVDRDGREDIVVGIATESCVSVFLSDGAGGFVEDQLLVTGQPLRPFVQDADGDGNPDLFVVSSGVDVVNLYRGLDDGLAGARMLEPGLDAGAAAWVAAGDFDGDGANELATASYESTNVSVLDFETGPGGRVDVVGRTPVDMMRRIGNLEAGDLDQDGRPDLVAAVEGTVGGGIVVMQNTSANGQLAFTRFPADPNFVLAAGNTPTGILIGDVDGDGLNDVVAAFYDDRRIRVLRRIGVGMTFANPVDIDVEGNPIGVASGDFDGDGQLEIAVTRSDVASVRIIGALGGGSFATELDVPVGLVPLYIRSADFNQDFRTDLVVTNNAGDTLSVLISNPAGGFLTEELPAGERPTALLTQDLDDDGDVDILAASLRGYDFRVLVGDGTGSFAQALVFPGAYTASAAALSDLSGNGLPELSVGSVLHRRIAVFQNTTR